MRSPILRTAAQSVAARLEREAVATEQARDAEVKEASKNKTAMGKDYWQPAWKARQRADAARKIADAVKEAPDAAAG